MNNDFSAILSEPPHTAQRSYHKGKEAVRLGKLEEAQKWYKDALEHYPYYLSAISGLLHLLDIEIKKALSINRSPSSLVDQLSRYITPLSKIAETAKKECLDLNDKLKSKESELDTLNIELQKQKTNHATEHRKYQEQLFDYRNRIDFWERKAKKLELELNSSQRELESLCQDPNRLTAVLIDLTKPQEEFNSEIMKQIEALNSRAIKSKEEKDILLKELAIANDKYQSLDREVAELQDKLKEENRKELALNAQSKILHDKETLSKFEQRQLKDVIERTESNIAALKKDSSNIDIQLKQLKSTENSLKVEIEEYKRKLAQERNRFADQQKFANQILEELKTLQHTDLRKEIQALLKKISPGDDLD